MDTKTTLHIQATPPEIPILLNLLGNIFKKNIDPHPTHAITLVRFLEYLTKQQTDLNLTITQSTTHPQNGKGFTSIEINDHQFIFKETPE